MNQDSASHCNIPVLQNVTLIFLPREVIGGSTTVVWHKTSQAIMIRRYNIDVQANTRRTSNLDFDPTLG